MIKENVHDSVMRNVHFPWSWIFKQEDCWNCMHRIESVRFNEGHLEIKFSLSKHYILVKLAKLTFMKEKVIWRWTLRSCNAQQRLWIFNSLTDDRKSRFEAKFIEDGSHHQLSQKLHKEKSCRTLCKLLFDNSLLSKLGKNKQKGGKVKSGEWSLFEKLRQWWGHQASNVSFSKAGQLER